MPWSGPRSVPFMAASSASRAAASARSSVRRRKAWSVPSSRAMRSRQARVSSTGDIRRAAMSAAASAMVGNVRAHGAPLRSTTKIVAGSARAGMRGLEAFDQRLERAPGAKKLGRLRGAQAQPGAADERFEFGPARPRRRHLRRRARPRCRPAAGPGRGIARSSPSRARPTPNRARRPSSPVLMWRRHRKLGTTKKSFSSQSRRRPPISVTPLPSSAQ